MNDYFYTCKWHCPINELEIVEPDYLHDIWDLASPNGNTPEAASLCDVQSFFPFFSAARNSEYQSLKEDYKKLEQDFAHVSRIVTIAATLHKEYTVR